MKSSSPPTPPPHLRICVCGCGRTVDPARIRKNQRDLGRDPHGHPTYATDACGARVRQRRALHRVHPIEMVLCPVCNDFVVRTPRTRRRKYHPHCRATAKKALRRSATARP